MKIYGSFQLNFLESQLNAIELNIPLIEEEK